MSKDYPTGEELDKMSDKEEWEWEDDDTMMWPGEIHAPGELYVKMSKVKKKLAIERAKVEEWKSKLCWNCKCDNDHDGNCGPYASGCEGGSKYQPRVSEKEKKDLEAQVEKLKGENAKLRGLFRYDEGWFVEWNKVDEVLVIPKALADDAPEGGGEVMFRCKKCHSPINRDMVDMKEIDSEKVVHQSEYLSCPKCGFLIDEEDIYDPNDPPKEDPEGGDGPDLWKTQMEYPCMKCKHRFVNSWKDPCYSCQGSGDSFEPEDPDEGGE